MKSSAKTPHNGRGFPDCGVEQVKRVCFSLVHLQGLYNMVLGASYNNAVITRLESWGWLRQLRNHGTLTKANTKLQRCSKMLTNFMHNPNLAQFESTFDDVRTRELNAPPHIGKK